MQGRLRALAYGPKIGAGEGLSSAATAIDAYHRSLADSNLHGLIPVLEKFDDDDDFNSECSEDEFPMQDLLALDGETLEHLGVYDKVHRNKDREMIPDFESGTIIYNSVEHMEIHDSGKRKPTVSHPPPTFECPYRFVSLDANRLPLYRPTAGMTM